MQENNYSWVGWVVAIAIIWGGYALFSTDDSKDSTYHETAPSTYRATQNSYEEDGYEWAEYNDVSSFDDCQDQFGTGNEEDECNRYVKENYSGYNSFNGYDCTEDCSGHEAGYNWAEENDIYDESDCGGNSNSFIEGCISYVEDYY
jgi:hypothetical protein